MKSIIITGCNRGIGFGLVKYLSENYQQMKYIFATCRNPETAPELCELSKKNRNIHILKADMRKETDIKQLVNEVSTIMEEKSLDILINNAGISSKFTRVKLVKHDELMEHFQINTVAPILMTKAFLPLLKSGYMKTTKFGKINGIVINISSTLGSIQDNTTGGFYPYRTSKAALNAATKSMSIDLKDDGITVVSLHPGWVKTEMGGPNATMSVVESITGIMKFIVDLTPQHSGLFYSYDGKQLPW